ncbi:PKD domain-containing protein [Fictibacillus sp. KIGAM418]|uniref:PKD domain-containing protein n=1 Tax=Fictibacillus marinisediminis TaxID=2878389 RepID=A0A9X1XEG5_9BACL|nr:PKD domain-containing protein [Fictibacillus marinisediminis]MCK6259412.1 PKD domain-containing protein [Fictibacillus marinisediminis]
MWNSNFSLKIIKVLLAVLIFGSSFYGTAAFAANYPATEKEFFEYLANIGRKRFSENGEEANFSTFKTYDVIVYGSPRDVSGNESASGGYCGHEREYRYLGFNTGGNKVTNQCFRNDATGSETPEQWDYQVVDSNTSSWDNMSTSLEQHILNSKVEGHNAKNLTVNGMGGKRYAKITARPTWRSSGTVYTEHKGEVSIWYATFKIPPMIGDTLIDTKIASDKTTYYIDEYSNSTEADITVTSQAKLKGYARESDISKLTVSYGDDTRTDRKDDLVTLNKTIKFDRSKYPGNKSSDKVYDITLKGSGTVRSVFNDYDEDEAEKDIRLVVKPYVGDPYVKASAEATPKSQAIKGDEATIKVSVTGEMKNVKDGSNIDYWAFEVKKKGDKTAQIKKVDKSTRIQDSPDFTFTVPASKVISSTFKQEFEAVAKAKLKSGSTKEDENTTYANVTPPDTIGMNLTGSAATSPASQKLVGTSAAVNVTVKGSVDKSFSTSLIDHWEFEAKKKQEPLYTKKIVQSSKVSDQATIPFSIPAASVTTDEFLQDFDAKITVVLTTGKRTTVEAATKANIYKEVAPPTTPEEPPGGGEPTEPPPPPNQPPVANVFVGSEYYWVETVTAGDSSYDPDGTIVDKQFYFDDEPSGTTFKSARVESPESHNVRVKVTDDDGDTAEDQEVFRILPTTPVADFTIEGTKKENRKMILRGEASEGVTPSARVAPLDYTKSVWKITPVTLGIDQSDILIRQASNKKALEFLVRKAGDYQATLTITNVYGEISKPVTKKFTIVEDQVPEAKFTVNAKKVVRDKTTKEATIHLEDLSESKDNDPISKRTFYVEYDSNNDGVIGTPQDSPRQAIYSGPNKSFDYKTDKVGNYRFSVDVKESFGQPTLEEFIQEQHYKRDSSDVLHPRGTISYYQQDENFNLPSSDKMVEVTNVAPLVDFSAIRKNKVDIVLNFGGLDTATQQHLTGKAYNDGEYDHYYYTIDQTYKNRMTAAASNLETNLLQKGIDAKVTIDNSYYHTYDSDGTGIRHIPQWGLTYWQTYEYQTVTTSDSHYSPPAEWAITGITSEATKTVSQSFSSTCTDTFTWDGKHWDDPSGWSHSFPSTISYNSGGYSGVLNRPPTPWPECPASPPSYDGKNVGDTATGSAMNTLVYTGTVKKTISGYISPEGDSTVYTYQLKKTIQNQRWEIQYYYDQGISSTEQVNTTDFTSAYSNQSFRTGAQAYYIKMDKNPWDWMGNSSKLNSMVNKSKANSIFFWNMATTSNKNNVERLIGSGSQKGQFTTYDAIYLTKNMKDIEDYFLNQFMIKQNSTNLTVVLGDQVDFQVFYEDAENDPELKREYLFKHDPTTINGREIDNQPDGPIPENNKWMSQPINFSRVGTYLAKIHSLDNPIFWDDDRFFNYRKWSDEEVQKEVIINVHRRPIADFSFKIDIADNYRLDLDPSLSYDPDHEKNMKDKGIVNYTWVSYTVDGTKYDGSPPAHLQPNKVYDATLQVEDIDGAYGTVTKRISTENVNIKPVAKFNVQSLVSRSQKLEFTDLSYDPNGDPLTNYQFTIRKQADNTLLKTLNDWPTSFKDMNLPAGDYVIGLTVWDIPKFPPALQSDLYERQIKIVNDNQPPVSIFSLNPNPVEIGQPLTYKDSSYDPDNHNPLKYSWKIEKVDADGSVIQTWETGAPPKDFRDFGGVGKYKVYQTVWDSPPAPLTPLSDTFMVTLDVIEGPKHPYAEFTWHPEDIITEGDTIYLDPLASYDLDGDVVGYDWKIKDPSGAVTTSTEMFPNITNSKKGTYQVELNVIDDDGLKSMVPAKHDIEVLPMQANIPPVANFDWLPFTPFLGTTVAFNPDASFDPDGKIVSYSWKFKSKSGTTTTSTDHYPSFTAASDYYDVDLTIKDDRGGTGTLSQRVNVQIASLQALVTHTPTWKDTWVKNEYDPDINIFRAGEHFVIELTSTPANKVEGSVDFGGKIGKVDIPSSAFTLVSSKPFEMKWCAELYRDDFKFIPDGEYMFNFKSYHPVANPYVEATDNYIVKIQGNIFEELGYHRSY